jgi:hypothetical protein
VLHADTSRIPESTMLEVEADTFWCLSRLLQSILDNYTFAQPGIQRKTLRMQELMARIDGKLSRED